MQCHGLFFSYLFPTTGQEERLAFAVIMLANALTSVNIETTSLALKALRPESNEKTVTDVAVGG
jgi:hypothetical protein